MSNETKHTPTPWAIEVSERACFHEGNRVSIYRISQDGGETVVETVAEVWPTPGTDADVGDGRRIVAAVNAVEGIPTEALEDGVVSELLEAATAISKGIAEKETLRSRIELVREVVRDEAEYMKEDPHPEDMLHEIADGCVPVYYNDIADVFASAPDLGHGPGDLETDPDANCFEQLQAAIYEKLYEAAADEARELGLLD